MFVRCSTSNRPLCDKLPGEENWLRRLRIKKDETIRQASSVGKGASHSDACSFMCAGGSGFDPGADKLATSFHPSGVGKMRSN